jgi:aryl-alcohol dehydrogenase-like predicted oxidoreductase
MADNRWTRREFVRTGAVAAAGIAAGLEPTFTVAAGNPKEADTSKILNYKADMEYRRCGKTNLMVSAVCLGGHWKKVNVVVPGLFSDQNWLSAKLNDPRFEQNRTDVISRCIDRGINYVDACTGEEVIMYAKALKGRRDKMYLGYSYYQKEVRFPHWRTFEKLKQSLDEGMREAGLDYVDLWRITCNERSSQHTQGELEELVKALDWAKKSGRARFTGISSHDRLHIKSMIEQFPDQLEVIVTPYTADTVMVDDESGLWAALQKHDVGWFGIKPYLSGKTSFKGDGSPGNPQVEEDNRNARLVLRYILCNPAITAPIPGMITPEQVDNAALAVKERRELDAKEQADLRQWMDRAWANLPYHYRWLQDWKYV